MANHCTDVICSSCGAAYCLRGCGDDEGPKKTRAWALRVAVSGKARIKPYGLRCRHCGGYACLYDAMYLPEQPELPLNPNN